MKKSHIAIALFCLIFLFFFMLERESPEFQPALDEYGACMDNFIANSPIARTRMTLTASQYDQFIRAMAKTCNPELQKVGTTIGRSQKSLKKINELVDKKHKEIQSKAQVIWEKCSDM